MIVYGLNPVIEALRAGRVRRLKVGPRGDKRTDEAVALAKTSGIQVERVDAQVLERLSRGGVHQGIAAEVEAPRDYSVQELVDGAAPDAPLLVVLDGVEDPHNVGAIVRSVDAAGGHGIIRQERHAASLDGIAAKASAGALAVVKVATVVNIARALEELKGAGVWTVGFAGEGSEAYDVVDFTLPTAIVVGGEGDGLRRLTKDRCDRLVKIPMAGAVDSLNVSVAAGVALFEAARQRRLKSR
ncbi:MAG: 23S rRNA (guanosine(2251)-2'-O)-methyltransferase RlmB [Acidobacteriota bacterium]|nr:23S rRNA (guanosine(2251)-2'-O)-methyltransferase RlmB [Acidobacteriota bacterium]